MKSDAKQKRLRTIFTELRRLKQEELPRQLTDPVQQAYHDVRVQRAIVNVERKIEGVMSDENA